MANGARESVIGACERWRGLVFFLVSGHCLRQWNLTAVHGKEKVYGSIRKGARRLWRFFNYRTEYLTYCEWQSSGTRPDGRSPLPGISPDGDARTLERLLFGEEVREKRPAVLDSRLQWAWRCSWSAVSGPVAQGGAAEGHAFRSRPPC